MKPFLGRERYDANTATYSFRDGSGVVPEEMREELIFACSQRVPGGGNALFVLGTLFAWKARLEANSRANN